MRLGDEGGTAGFALKDVDRTPLARAAPVEGLGVPGIGQPGCVTDGPSPCSASLDANSVGLLSNRARGRTLRSRRRT